MGADGEKGRVEAARFHSIEDVFDLRVHLEFDAKVEDTLNLGVKHVAR